MRTNKITVAEFGFEPENFGAIKSERATVELNQFHPLYPALYPGADFQSQKWPKGVKGETNKTIVNIVQISDCIPKLKIAKNVILDFQSSALPTELPSLP